MFGPNRFKLGLFAINCSGGQSVTKVPERWDASWEHNLQVTQMAEQVGLEFIVPIARWRGYGGPTNFQGTSLETMSWACGLLAHTEKITVFGTVHAPMFHPIIVAKQAVTIDQMSRGRFGLNIVCGWNQDEFDMFGMGQREHDVRYDYGQEWIDIIRRIWAGESPFDFQGRFFHLRNVEGSPRPYGDRNPVIMNAGASPAGRRFAALVSDFHFHLVLEPEEATEQIRETKRIAREHGREIQVFTSCHVVCRSTQKEADEYLHYYVDENADWESAEHLADLFMLGSGTRTFPPELVPTLLHRIAAGHGVLPAVGDPDRVARELKRVADAGFEGSTLSFVNYLDELPYFSQEVLPRLERMGLRQPSR
jgi:dimethylsulfone monooxygenase